jgi:hypothetical protein
MKLEVDKTFLALTPCGSPLLCSVDKIKDNVAYCSVINGGWEIGFDTSTLEMCREGTHPYAQKSFDKGFGAKVVLTDLPRTGRRSYDYNERIADALKVLEEQKK